MPSAYSHLCILSLYLFTRGALQMENDFKDEYLNLKDACAYFGLGRISLVKLATSADAIHRLGNRVFYNVKTMKNYIDTHKSI